MNPHSSSGQIQRSRALPDSGKRDLPPRRPRRSKPQQPTAAKKLLAGESVLTRPQQKLLKQCGDPVCYSLGLKNLKNTDLERGFKQLKQTWFVGEARKLVFAIPVDDRGIRTATRMKKLGIFKEMHTGADLFGTEHAHLRLTRAGATFLLRMLKTEERARPARQVPLPFFQ